MYKRRYMFTNICVCCIRTCSYSIQWCISSSSTNTYLCAEDLCSFFITRCWYNFIIDIVNIKRCQNNYFIYFIFINVHFTFRSQLKSIAYCWYSTISLHLIVGRETLHIFWIIVSIVKEKYIHEENQE